MTLANLGNLRCDVDLIDRKAVTECCAELKDLFPGQDKLIRLMTAWMLDLLARDEAARRGECMLRSRLKGKGLSEISWTQTMEIAG